MFKVDGILIDKWEVTTRKKENGKYILIDIAKEIKGKMKEKEIQRNDAGIYGGVKLVLNMQ